MPLLKNHGAYGVMVSTGVCGAPSPGSNPGRHPLTDIKADAKASVFMSLCQRTVLGA